MKKTYFLISSGVLAVLVVSASIFFVPAIHIPITTWFSFAFAPQEVQNMIFLTGKDRDHFSFSTTHFGFVKTISYSDKTFLEAVSLKGNTVALLKNSEGKTDLYSIGNNGKVTSLTADGRDKSSLAISQDGSAIAFSYVANISSKEKLLAEVSGNRVFDLNHYELVIFDVATKKITRCGDGTYAHFIDTRTIFFVSSKGFVLKDIPTGEENIFPDQMASYTNTIPVFITNDTFVMRNAILPQFDSFKILSRNPLRLSAMGTVHGFDARKVYALSSNENGTLYGVGYSDSGKLKTLLSVKEGKTKQNVFTFPENFLPQDIITIKK